MVNAKNQVHVNFLMAKSCVAPLKLVSIPRLELTAAVVSINVTTMLKNKLNYENLQSVYYTDSEAVTGYTSNDAHNFHVYVGTRVQHICDWCDPRQWHHIAGSDSLVDEASHALTAELSLNNKR